MNFKTKLFLILLSSFYIQLNAHKMIILVSTPRSLSTVFLRMMENRGDFTIFNEPGIITFLKTNNNPLVDESDESTSFSNVWNTINAAHNDNHIFIKEMFFAADAYLINENFMQNRDCYFVFLVRNPHHASLSNFKKLYGATKSYTKIWNIKRTVCHFMIYSALYLSYQNVLHNSINRPYVIIAEDLITHPNKTVTDFCNFVGIPMKEEFLQWESHTNYPTEEKWNDPKSSDMAHFWHEEALKSSCFPTPTQYKTNANGEPTFEEIESTELRASFLWEYFDNLTYYNLFTKITDTQS